MLLWQNFAKCLSLRSNFVYKVAVSSCQISNQSSLSFRNGKSFNADINNLIELVWGNGKQAIFLFHCSLYWFPGERVDGPIIHHHFRHATQIGYFSDEYFLHMGLFLVLLVWAMLFKMVVNGYKIDLGSNNQFVQAILKNYWS